MALILIFAFSTFPVRIMQTLKFFKNSDKIWNSGQKAPGFTFLMCYNLSFYRFQMFCAGPDFFELAQRFNCIYLCLVLLQVAKCFVPIQIFCVRPKNYLHIVPVTNFLCQTKRWFAFSKIGFYAGTKVFEEALNAVKFLSWLIKFGSAQNILRPVKGQGIRFLM